MNKYNKKKDISSNLLNIKCTSEESINNVNNFFVNAGRNIAEKILQDLKTTENDLAAQHKCSYSPTNSFMLLGTDVTEITKIIKSLKNSSSSGWDGISSIYLKRFVNYLAVPITHLCNLSINSGLFPRLLKESIVVPIHKQGDVNNISNYRPISLLPTLAKILEKVINYRLVHYLESNNLLSENQYGFRRNKSTSEAIDTLVSHVVRCLDGKLKCLGVFLDLAKAFDTVSIPLLLCKLEKIGIRGLPLQLLKDYLTDRSQSVKIGDMYSPKSNINYGVPQGSVLGPTLFLIYFNTICQTELKNCRIIAYADDTVLLFTEKTWDGVKKVTEAGMQQIMTLLNKNLLTLNVSKTKCIPFSIKSNSSVPENYFIKAHNCSHISNCNCYSLTIASSIKYLGIALDKNLNWKEHINNLKSRLRKLIPVFKKVRHLGCSHTNKIVYYSLCQSLLSYGIISWGSAPKTTLLKLERAQRFIIKVILYKRLRHPTTDLYKEFQTLSVRQLYIKHAILKQHTIRRDYFSDRRSHVIYKVPLCNTKFAQSFSDFLCPFLYNCINKELVLEDKTKSLCEKLLRKYLNDYDYNQTEKLLKKYT